MKDLLVFAADADAEAFLRAVLGKPQALGIRPVTVDIKRHPQRDSGMVQSGAELVRMQKGRYGKALLLWDHHGSGRDREEPSKVRQEIQGKLDSFTWSGNSAVTILVPELEQWLWYCETALAAHWVMTKDDMALAVDAYAAQNGIRPEEDKRDQPKELFEHIARKRLKRTISPYDFEKIGEKASIKALIHCPSFRAIGAVLQEWFPVPEHGAALGSG